MLLITAILFKIPLWIWELMEGDVMKSFYDPETKTIAVHKNKDKQ